MKKSSNWEKSIQKKKEEEEEEEEEEENKEKDKEKLAIAASLKPVRTRFMVYGKIMLMSFYLCFYLQGSSIFFPKVVSLNVEVVSLSYFHVCVFSCLSSVACV